MRYAVIADIHANLEAFSAILADIGRRGGVDEYWVLGDITGYGPDPHACIELVRRLPGAVVAGNHDAAAVRRYPLHSFNPEAAAAVEWTEGHLSDGDIQYLRSLPATLELQGFTLTHGSPRQPGREYISSIPTAGQIFEIMTTPHAMVGHTHQPAVFKREESGAVVYIPFKPGIGLVVGKGRFIINPGSVGEPRDGDPRASYAIYDNEATIIRLYRVSYDVGATQDRMISENLPVRLAARLGRGQ
ncbi:metallophosphoesterase family protein [Dehalogenimonas sp. THU2]|uniref:metallophosphoesterase family protein n=1 Tax=Dehalogenimonas sp. THU2 TaxID=3151121 RepID=UPI003218C558